jgi:hypothetical protein
MTSKSLEYIEFVSFFCGMIQTLNMKMGTIDRIWRGGLWIWLISCHLSSRSCDYPSILFFSSIFRNCSLLGCRLCVANGSEPVIREIYLELWFGYISCITVVLQVLLFVFYSSWDTFWPAGRIMCIYQIGFGFEAVVHNTVDMSTLVLENQLINLGSTNIKISIYYMIH